MPISEAALEGIATNGHRWKYHLNGLISAECKKLGEFNDLLNGLSDPDQKIIPVEQSKPVVDAIVTKMRQWIEKQSQRRDPPGFLIEDLGCKIDELEEMADCDMEEINYVMGRLYDEFDYWRILAS